MGFLSGKSGKMPRFVEVYKQSVAGDSRILVDTVTGVNYLWHRDNSYAAGLTVMLNADGTPVVMPQEILAEMRRKQSE